MLCVPDPTGTKEMMDDARSCHASVNKLCLMRRLGGADGNGWVVLNCIIDVHLNVPQFKHELVKYHLRENTFNYY